METNTRTQEGNNNPSPIPSPHNNESNNNNKNKNNGGIGTVQIQTSPNPRSDSCSNPTYPTTFVQADTSTFKQVVQMLTGSSSPSTKLDQHHQRNFPIPPIKNFAPKKPHQGNSSINSSFKLYERRNYNIKNGLMSPSMLDFPRLTLSPVTPLTEDPFKRVSSSPSSVEEEEEEERAIAEKGFYLHPSPRDDSEIPQLLPLFPLTSPRVSESTS